MKLLTFSLAVIWFYAFVAGLVPESSTAVNLTELDWSDPEAVAEQGALVFNGKGQCSRVSYCGYLCATRQVS